MWGGQEGGERESKHVQQLRTLTTFSEDLSSILSSKSGSSQLILPPAQGDMTLSLASVVTHTHVVYTYYKTRTHTYMHTCMYACMHTYK